MTMYGRRQDKGFETARSTRPDPTLGSPTKLAPALAGFSLPAHRGALSPRALLPLQRLVGNRVVTRILDPAPALGVRLQRALAFSELQNVRNTAPNAKLARRRSWLAGLVRTEVNRVFSGVDIAVWKKENPSSVFQVESLIDQLEKPEVNFANQLTTSDFAGLNDLIHQLEVTVDKKKAAPRSIANVLVGNEFTFVDAYLSGLSPVATRKGEEVKDAVHRVMQGPYNNAAGRWFDKMTAKGVAPAEDKVDDGMRYLTYRFSADNYGVDWEYKVTPDQLCVEVITTKAKVSKVFSGPVGDLMDEYVFAIAESANLAAHATIGGGHVNIDETTAFGSDPRGAAQQLAIFMTEFYKDSPYWGGIDPDKTNAPFPSEMTKGGPVGKGKVKPTKAEDFEKVIREFKGGTIAELADKLIRDVFSVSLVGDGRDAPKFQALNVKNLSAEQGEQGLRRIEVRRVPAQKDRADLIEHLRKIAELLEKSGR
jgi:hypothetical protein